MIVKVRERGAAPIAAQQWAALAADPGFQDLVSRDVLAARPTKGRQGWQLTAGNHVGHALLGGVQVEIVEKITGALAAMTKVLAPRAFKLASAQSPLIFAQAPHAALVTMFLASVRAYLSGAKLIEYSTIDEKGAYVSGRLDIPRTAALRARGVRHKVAFRRTILSDDLPINRVAFRALGEVLTGAADGFLRQDDVTAARSLRAGFGECVQPAVSMTRKEIVTLAINEADRTARRREAMEMAALAVPILQGASTADDTPYDAVAPRSWFLNLENLFERMVRTSVAVALRGQAHVSGPVDRPPLFPDIPNRFQANPDVVVRTDQGVILLDAKYKDFEGWPSTSDLHEILAHAASYRAQKAALLYPSSDTFFMRDLGHSSTNCRVWVFVIPFSEIEKSIAFSLSQLGLPVGPYSLSGVA